MKNLFQIISGIGLAIIILSLGMIAISGLTGCSPKFTLPDVNLPVNDLPPVIAVKSDTVIRIDTVEFAGYVLTVHDSIPCPAGLENDSIIYTTFTKYLPGREVVKTVTIRDTIRITPQRATTTSILPPSGGGWSERLSWLGGILLLLAALWKKWKGEQQVKTA